MGIVSFFQGDNWKNLIMIAVACVLLYLAIGKKFEPLLLLPIAFGMLLTNLPGADLYHQELWDAFVDPSSPVHHSYGAILGAEKPLRQVSKTEKIIFPIVVTLIVFLLVPSAAPLVGCLMLGNLFNVCGVTERLSKTVQNELCNIVTIFLGVSVGATATAQNFLSPRTLLIIAMGVVAFGLGTAGGVLLAKFMNLFLKEKINPLIGSAGVSAVPMAARVSQTVGQKENPGNFLLMHAMGPNVSGVIGSAIAAGVLLALFG